MTIKISWFVINANNAKHDCCTIASSTGLQSSWFTSWQLATLIYTVSLQWSEFSKHIQCKKVPWDVWSNLCCVGTAVALHTYPVHCTRITRGCLITKNTEYLSKRVLMST
jgi:hypothetical protein